MQDISRDRRHDYGESRVSHSCATLNLEDPHGEIDGEPLIYSHDAPPAEPCEVCKGRGLLDTGRKVSRSGNEPQKTPCPHCAGIGYSGIDPRVPTCLMPGTYGKAAVLAARYRDKEVIIEFCRQMIGRHERMKHGAGAVGDFGRRLSAVLILDARQALKDAQDRAAFVDGDAEDPELSYSPGFIKAVISEEFWRNYRPEKAPDV